MRIMESGSPYLKHREKSGAAWYKLGERVDGSQGQGFLWKYLTCGNI
jgi:hypothetical protein